jgi:hypothetical protein
MDRRDPVSITARTLSITLALACCLAALVLFPHEAHAQLEARCPPGWDALPTQSGGGARMIASCERGPMQITALLAPQPIAAGSADESMLGNQLVSQLVQGQVSAAAFRNETIGGHALRIADINGQGQSESGATTRVEGSEIFIPTAGSTLIVLGLSRDAAHGNARAAVRAFVSTIVGLDGAQPAWRASATCPPGTSSMPVESGFGPNGMRIVVQCVAEGALELVVSESRLPVHDAADARAGANAALASITRRFRSAGANATMDPTTSATFGSVQGFKTAFHASISDPRLPGGQVHIEALVVIIPTTIGGHVQVLAVSPQATAPALEQQVSAFVTGRLRLDGTNVQPPGATGDGGASSQSPGARQHAIDPNAPIWSPTDEDNPQHHGAPPAAQNTSTSSSRTGLYLAIGLAVAIGLVIVRVLTAGSRYRRR